MQHNLPPGEQADFDFTTKEQAEAALVALAGIGSLLLRRPQGGDITNPTAMIASRVRRRLDIPATQEARALFLAAMNEAIPTKTLKDRFEIGESDSGGPVGRAVVISRKSPEQDSES